MLDKLIFLPDHVTEFPSVECALEHPQGLLAIGGNLKVETLLMAYKKGIFPWFNEGDPILWWSVSPRMVLVPGEIHVSRSLRKLLRKKIYKVTFDFDFHAVISSCANRRKHAEGTWITDEMINAYTALHNAGHAHSVEVWLDKKLVGGLYGVAQGQMFFAESMFSLKSNTSKIAMTALSEQLLAWKFQLIDCQIYSDHLASLGAKRIPRQHFTAYLEKFCTQTYSPESWRCEWN